MRGVLILIFPISLFSIGLNDLVIFSTPVYSDVSFIASVGESWGIGIGVKKKDFEAGFSLPNGLAFFSHKSSQNLLVLKMESAKLVIAGSTMENFSYQQISLKKTPPILRFATRLSTLPRCKRGDKSCLEKRKSMEGILEILFNSSALYRRVSSLRLNYSLVCASIPPLPVFGFYKANGFTFAGFGRTDGKNAVMFGPGWGNGFGMGIGISFGDPVRLDLALFGGEGGFKYSMGVQVNVGKVNLFAILSQDGFRVVLF